MSNTGSPWSSDVQLYDNGGTWSGAETAPAAAILSLPTEILGSTTTTVGCTSDSAVGTLYWFVSDSASAPSVANLKAGTGSTDFGSTASISVGANIFLATGLTAEANYYTYFVQNNGSDSNVLESGIWTTTAAPSISRTRIVSPEYTFTDDFEGVRDNTFWEDSTNTTYGATATQDAGYAGGKVMSFLYEANGSQFPDSWSEQRMRFPACVQLEMSYKIFVPANYVHPNVASDNNKVLAIWGGTYGTAASNVSCVVENYFQATGVSGSTPDLGIGYDGNNFGHSRYEPSIDTDRIYLTQDGNWHEIGVYFVLPETQGAYGKYELWLDDKLILSTDWDLAIADAADGTPTSQQIGYSTRGNFLDQAYLLGWANSGFAADTTFYVDDFSLRTRSTSVGSTT